LVKGGGFVSQLVDHVSHEPPCDVVVVEKKKCIVEPEGFVSLTAPGKKADGTLCSCVFSLA